MRPEKSILLFLIIFAIPVASSQAYFFDTCSNQNRYGPDPGDCNYGGNNDVNIVGNGMQVWTVPQSGVYRIEAAGATGGGSGGYGAWVEGEFDLNSGESIGIVVGQTGANSASGGGGTFVVDGNSFGSAEPLLVAAGGGGTPSFSGAKNLQHGTAPTSSGSATDGRDNTCGTSVGGTGGNGGDFVQSDYYEGGSGAGFYSGGEDPTQRNYEAGGEAFRNDPIGGESTAGFAPGGYGGGGGGYVGDESGAGGGYNGGGGGSWSGCGSSDSEGGGGGSYIDSSASNADGRDSDNNNRGYVRIEIVTNPDNPTIQNLNFNRQAGNPATIDGSFDVNIDHDGGNAPNNELESCTVTAEGVDSGGQVNLNTNINGDSCSFSVANNDHGNWNPDEELKFSMSVEDSYGGTDDLTSFRQFPVNPPNEPDQPSPEDNVESVDTESSLQVRATHPDGLDMDVRFFLDDGSGFSQVGPTRTVSDGSNPSVSPELDPGADYTWYAEASTQGRTTESTRWNFTTNYRPSVDSLEVKQLDSGHAVNLSAVVSDRDGGNQIDDCELSVTDDEGDSDSPVVVMRDGSSPNEAKCLVGRIDFEDSSWKHLELLDFNLTVNDDKGLSDHETTSEKLPNNAPEIEAFDVVSYRDREAFSVSSVAQFKDDGSSEIRSCSIVIDDGENSYSVGSMTRIDSSKARCEVDNVGPDRFSGIRVNEELEILVRATDSHGKTGTFETLYNVPTGIDYDYTAMMLQSGGVDFVDYTVSNNADGESDFRTTIEGVNATFISNGQSEIEYSLSQSQTNSFRVKVSPEIGEYRTKQMKIITENLNTGIKQVNQMPVDVRRNTQPTENTVPGISLIQILALISIAGLIYVRRL